MYIEEKLIQQLRNPATREQAFTLLVSEYQEQLYWQIRRMVTSHQDADDVLQNVFLKAWQALDSFRAESRLSTWLYRIAYNETLNYMKRNSHNSISLSAGYDDGDSEMKIDLEGDSYFDGDKAERQLQEAVAQLPPKQRQVFNLKYFQEMKYEDMSDILGTSIGALKASYHHAVQKVTSFFENND
jgi:RNA polymerase sigma-70 factor (ECF subfamily)